jgi:hypothetical protein
MLFAATSGPVVNETLKDVIPVIYTDCILGIIQPG